MGRRSRGAISPVPIPGRDDVEAALARAAIDAALSRQGEPFRDAFRRAVDRCYNRPYRPILEGDLRAVSPDPAEAA